jgi:hypothetical protein
VDLFRTRPLERILAESESKNALQRSLGPFALVALGVGAVVGAGIFTLTGVVAAGKVRSCDLRELQGCPREGFELFSDRPGFNRD